MQTSSAKPFEIFKIFSQSLRQDFPDAFSQRTNMFDRIVDYIEEFKRDNIYKQSWSNKDSASQPLEITRLYLPHQILKLPDKTVSNH